MKKALGFLLRAIISLGLLVYLFRKTDLTALKEAFLSYSPGWWLAGLAAA